ncbi:MAG: hypothetical protein NT165_03925 [Candidatus Falkowbacteria bacterium]|nr:hypothetical protein [Candidatus Falkowbacteria bacterium]
MKITIGGSMTFAKEQVEIKRQLEQRGHEVLVTDDIEDYINNSAIKNSFEEELELSLKYDVMRTFFKKIDSSDAFLVCNYSKNGVSGRLGISALMELGLAYHLGKKTYLLFETDKVQDYALEVAIINPIILNGDISII